MGKAKRKPRPSMPHWFWFLQDGCWFCENRNNCNQCKANRDFAKGKDGIPRHRDERQKIKGKVDLVDYE